LIPAPYMLLNPGTLLYVGDCREVLPSLREGSVDLLIADPPFNIGVAYGSWDDSLPHAEYMKFTYEWIDECCRVLRPGGTLWLHCPHSLVSEADVYVKGKGWERLNLVVWSYRFGQHTEGRFIDAACFGLYFVKPGGVRTWNPKDVLVPSDRASKYGDARTQQKAKGTAGMRVPLSMWGSEGDGGFGWGRVTGNSKERRPLHQNQLPEVYLERIIKATTNPGDLVLDPFAGSGTSSTVARVLQRRSITIEIDPALAASAWERIEKGAVRVERQEPMPLLDIPGVLEPPPVAEACVAPEDYAHGSAAE